MDNYPQSLPEYLEQQNVIGISDVDTRAITRRLRDTGCLNGVITTESDKTDEELVAMARDWTCLLYTSPSPRDA